MAGRGWLIRLWRKNYSPIILAIHPLRPGDRRVLGAKGDNQGMVLLLALLALATILVTSLTVGSLVMRQLRLTTSADRAVVAYYAAESGLEQGLYLWRQEGLKGSQLTVSSSSPVSLISSQGQWWRDSQETQSTLITTLKPDEVKQIDLFDPAASLDDSPKAKSLKISWDPTATACVNQGQEWLELSWSSWGGAASDFDVQRRYINHSQIAASPGQAVIININNVGQPNYVNYRLRLKALYGGICNLQLTAYSETDGNGSVYALPARITISTTGQQADTRQALSITVPQFAPSSDVFDYTIFSQCSILKGNISETCP